MDILISVNIITHIGSSNYSFLKTVSSIKLKNVNQLCLQFSYFLSIKVFCNLRQKQ